MRLTSPAFLAIALLAMTTLAVPIRANYLKNTDLKDTIAGWDGDGERVLLKADGTEGQDGDPGVVPVIKLKLTSGKARYVSQDFDMPEQPKSLTVKVDVFATSDLKRSTDPEDYTGQNWKPGGTWYWSDLVIPQVDFWVRGSPGFFYKLANLKLGQWVTITGHFDQQPSAETGQINFCVPCGTGIVYLKNPSVTP